MVDQTPTPDFAPLLDAFVTAVTARVLAAVKAAAPPPAPAAQTEETLSDLPAAGPLAGGDLFGVKQAAAGSPPMAAAPLSTLDAWIEGRVKAALAKKIGA